MIVRSDIITRQDILDAVDAMNANVYFIYQRNERDGYMEPIRCFTPRRYKHGFEFFIAGSHYAQTQTRHAQCGEKAATWVEWGIIIDRLFKIDPDAQIGWYKNRDHFMRETERQAPLREVTAPWLLTDEEIKRRQMADRSIARTIASR